MIRAAVLALLLLAAPAMAVEPYEMLADPQMEERARAISAELRCLVCQNQSIDDSDAPLARDLRLLVRERLKAGDSDSEVRDFLVARYGEFVLLRPTISGRNLLLWITPLLVLVVGALVAARRFRARPAPPGAGLSPEEEQALAKVLARD